MPIEQDFQTQDQITGTLEQRDPFVQARKKSLVPNGIVPTASPFGESVQVDPAQQTLSQSMQPGVDKIIDFQSTDLPSMLKGVGLDSLSNLSLTEMGLVQLQAGLQQKFGQNFLANQSAKAIYDTFRSKLKARDRKEQDRDLRRMESVGQRTLRALLGGF